MKIRQNSSWRLSLCASLPMQLALCYVLLPHALLAADAPAAGSGDMVPLIIKLPAPAFKGTPKDIQLSSYVEPLSDKPRPPMTGPAGAVDRERTRLNSRTVWV